MKDVELVVAFQAAKRYLVKGGGDSTPPLNSRYICFALRSAQYQGISFEVVLRAQTLIQRRLGNHITIEEYLRAKGLLPKYSVAAKSKLQAFRHAWLDELIKEFS